MLGLPCPVLSRCEGSLGLRSAHPTRGTTRELRLARTSQRAWRTSVTLTSIPAKASFYRPPLIKRFLIAMPAFLGSLLPALLLTPVMKLSLAACLRRISRALRRFARSRILHKERIKVFGSDS